MTASSVRTRRRRRNTYRALYWLVSCGPALVLVLIALNVAGHRQPVVNGLTHWLVTHLSTPVTPVPAAVPSPP